MTVADSITVPAGQTNATFDLTIMDDAYVDGDKTVTITASAGPLSGYDTITVHDDEVPTLSLTIPATAGEGDGPLVGQGMLTVDAIPRGDLTVSLHSDDTTEAQVPSAVIIPGGQTSATFTVTIVDDTEIDGMKNATVTAQSPGWADGYDTINVLDNETTDLRVTVPAQAAEGNGVLTGTVSILISRL